jgi:hypothetical protein
MAGYIFLAVGITELLMFETASFGAAKMFSEFGFVQIAQPLFLLATVISMWAGSRLDANYRELAVCFTLFFAILLIRENDQIFELWLMHGFWKWPVLLVLIFLGWYFVKHRRAVIGQLEDFSHTVPFGILVAAMCTLVFSRLFGSSRFWEAVMTDDYQILAKAAAEEGTELFAMGLFLAFALEFLWMASRKNRGLD